MNTGALEVKFGDPSVAPLIQAAFPGARSGRTVKVEVASSYTTSDYWSDGSRDESRFVDLATLQVVSPSRLNELPSSNTYALSPGFCVVEHRIYCGKDLGYRVYLHSENMAPMLAKPAPEVDKRDVRILVTFRSIKSGPYRRETLAALKITESDLTRLVGKGWLKRSSNDRGAHRLPRRASLN
jgi:hypothetical protein